jgi:hypothetical protein
MLMNGDIRPEQKTFNLNPNQVSSDRKRPLSQTRETAIIPSSAKRPVLIESLNGLEEAPPTYVDKLGDRLAMGVDAAFIPQHLQARKPCRIRHVVITSVQHTFQNDSDIGHQIIKLTDFDRSDMRSAEELSSLYEAAKNIYLNARDCKRGNRDDNAWCDDVFRPLISLTIEVYGMGKWWLQSV